MCFRPPVDRPCVFRFSSASSPFWCRPKEHLRSNPRLCRAWNVEDLAMNFQAAGRWSYTTATITSRSSATSMRCYRPVATPSFGCGRERWPIPEGCILRLTIEAILWQTRINALSRWASILSMRIPAGAQYSDIIPSRTATSAHPPARPRTRAPRAEVTKSRDSAS